MRHRVTHEPESTISFPRLWAERMPTTAIPSHKSEEMIAERESGMAATRLKESRRSQKILQVPHKDMNKAVGVMRTVGVSGTVKNMSGTKKRYVSKGK